MIGLLFTGGTISMRLDPATGAAVPSLSASDILSQVPELQSIAEIEVEEFSRLPGPHVTPEQMWRLARRAAAWLERPDVQGLVITHGTDTIEETAYFLNLVVKTKKPVVLTAAMRPATALSADGPLNFFNAVGVASDPRAKGRGVLVVANDDIHGARAITKRHSTDVETFVSPEAGLVGVCLFDDREFARSPARAHTTATPFTVKTGQTLPRVDIIYAHAGMSPDLIDAAVANGAKGLVVAGVGDGNMTTPAVDAVKRALAKGVVVVRSSRVGEGIIRRNIELNDDALGTVASKELNPSKARVLLKLGLTQTTDRKQIQEYFDKY